MSQESTEVPGESEHFDRAFFKTQILKPVTVSSGLNISINSGEKHVMHSRKNRKHIIRVASDHYLCNFMKSRPSCQILLKSCQRKINQGAVYLLGWGVTLAYLLSALYIQVELGHLAKKNYFFLYNNLWYSIYVCVKLRWTRYIKISLSFLLEECP